MLFEPFKKKYSLNWVQCNKCFFMKLSLVLCYRVLKLNIPLFQSNYSQCQIIIIASPQINDKNQPWPFLRRPFNAKYPHDINLSAGNWKLCSTYANEPVSSLEHVFSAGHSRRNPSRIRKQHKKRHTGKSLHLKENRLASQRPSDIFIFPIQVSRERERVCVLRNDYRWW